MRLVNEPFDGFNTTLTTFEKVPVGSRFFTDDGIGYTKHTTTSCIDDYTFKEIECAANNTVWVKK
jgi:hypothetical protein